MTHKEWSSKKRLSSPCASWHITFGGRCLNCGWGPEKARRPEHIIEYKGETVLLYRDKFGRVLFWGNRPFNTLQDAKDAIDEIENAKGEDK